MELRDQALIGLVRSHLLENTELAGHCIDVISSEGCITLIGCVDTEEQKHLAGELAEGMVGVRQICNHIIIRGSMRE